MRWLFALVLAACAGDGGGGTCTAAVGEYRLTSVGEGFGTCDPQTVANMLLEIQNENDRFGTICIAGSTPCGPIGASSDGPFHPMLGATATALGVTAATFTLTGSGGCTERFAATFEPTGSRCAAGP